jgi:hypothetical protein
MRGLESPVGNVHCNSTSELYAVKSSQTHIGAISDYKHVNIKDMLRIYGLFNDDLAAKITACIDKISTFSSAIKPWLPSCKTPLFHRID